MGAYWGLQAIPERFRTGVRQSDAILQDAVLIPSVEAAVNLDVACEKNRDTRIAENIRAVEEREQNTPYFLQQPFPAYSKHEEIQICGFFNAVVRNTALAEKYPGGVGAFLQKHATHTNQDLSVTCAMGLLDMDPVFKDLEDAGLESKKDFCLVEPGLVLAFEKRIDFPVAWLEFAGVKNEKILIRYKGNTDPAS